MDGNGEGLVVGVAFLANEDQENVPCTIQAFPESSGAEAIQGVKTVVIDKDMSEMSALRTTPPYANIHLCEFHVFNTFNTKAESEEAKRSENFQTIATDFCVPVPQILDLDCTHNGSTEGILNIEKNKEEHTNKGILFSDFF